MNSTFYAGAAARNIVPSPELVNNSLHANMTVHFDEPGSPLQVKALVLRFNERDRMLVAVDSVGISRSHCGILRQALAEATEIPTQDIVISSSHSHSTPFLEPLAQPHPYFDFITKKAVEAAVEACKVRRKGRIGNAVTHVVGASFNTRVPLSNGGVKFTRDFREGLASGRPIDPRLNIVRIDDESGRPIAGWVRFAAHPACVIFNAPISAEYPGYLTDRLSETVTGGAPVLYAYGASGDVNCIPMFGKESDAAKLGVSLANLAAPAFEQIQTRAPERFLSGSQEIKLPLDPVPTFETLDREIEEVRAFSAGLDRDPSLEWLLGVNLKKDWSVEAKKAYVAPLGDWSQLMKQAIKSGRTFPSTWPIEVTSWIVDELGIVFYGGEPFAELGLGLAARSPLPTTLLVAMSNGCDAYLGTDEDRRRGGYELYTSPRYSKLAEETRPLPYALGAGECLLRDSITLIKSLLEDRGAA